MSKVSKFIDTLDINVGETFRGDCPECGGYKTFTVSNTDGNILFNCYKNSCVVHGSSTRNMPVDVIKDRLNAGDYSLSFEDSERLAFSVPPFVSCIKPDEDYVNGFMSEWGIDPDDVLYDVRQDRVVFTIRHQGQIVDAIGRALYPRNPKWLRYGASPVPYMCGEGDVMLVVEDPISAYRVSREFPNVVGVALLGTQLTDFHKWFFEKYFRYNKLIVALDYDAFNKTLGIVRELLAYVIDVRGLKLNEDLKYLNEDDVKALKEMLNANDLSRSSRD
jgi:hypothetical protein